jgi:signal transduction histidine kinase
MGANEGAGSRELNLVDPDDGTDLLFEVLTHDLSGVEGTQAGSTVSVLRDVTDLRRAANELEDRIRAATAGLADQNTRLQWQSRELEKANRLKSEFLASMSHELRTPINALIGYASLMLDRIYGDLTARQEEGLSRIQGAAQHLLALINDILDLAKIEAGRMPLHLEDITLGDIVTEISQQIEPLVKKKSLTFTVEMPSKDLSLYTDRTKVKQILLNLLSNAVKFTHHGGIWVTISKDEEDLRFDVRDTGIGIRATDLESIWEDFRQVDQSRTREFGGTGLGLSITRKLVDTLGGHVFAESVYGKGSTFTVVLPIRSVSRPEDPPRVIDEVPPPSQVKR